MSHLAHGFRMQPKGWGNQQHGKAAFLSAFDREFAIIVCMHFKTWVIFFLSFFLSCRSPVPTATSFLPTQRLQLGRAGLGFSPLSLWCLPAKYSYGVSRGVWGEKEIAWSGFSPLPNPSFIHWGRWCLPAVRAHHQEWVQLQVVDHPLLLLPPASISACPSGTGLRTPLKPSKMYFKIKKILTIIGIIFLLSPPPFFWSSWLKKTRNLAKNIKQIET